MPSRPGRPGPSRRSSSKTNDCPAAAGHGVEQQGHLLPTSDRRLDADRDPAGPEAVSASIVDVVHGVRPSGCSRGWMTTGKTFGLAGQPRRRRYAHRPAVDHPQARDPGAYAGRHVDLDP